MPHYEYVSTNPGAGCDFCSRPVAILQKISDPPMKTCPYCGHPTRRVISAPNIAGKHSRAPKTSEVEQAGFTQYRRIGKGDRKSTRLNSSHVAISSAVFRS